MTTVKQRVLEEYKEFFLNSDKYRYIILMGGRGGGRSTTASQFAVTNLLSEKYFRAAIMRFIYGDIKKSIFKEILDRIEEQEIENHIETTESPLSFTYGNNSIDAVGFRKSSGDQKSKLKSLAGYTTAIIEEADEVSEDDFMQLDDSIRTKKGNNTIILLLNPPSVNHWIIKRWFDLEKTEKKDFYKPILKDRYKGEVLFIESDYTKNKANLSPGIIRNYERYEETNPKYYYNAIKGYVSSASVGQVFTNWREIEEIPFEARFYGFGLDFGYSNDPTAGIAIYEYNGGYILDEVVYETHLLENDIVKRFKSRKEKGQIQADAADPRMIKNLELAGLDIIGAPKGNKSIEIGITFLQNNPISYTSRSKNLKIEIEKYKYAIDRKTGNWTEKPIDNWNHLMDSIRYGLSNKIFKEEKEEKQGNISKEYYIRRRFRKKNTNIIKR